MEEPPTNSPSPSPDDNPHPATTTSKTAQCSVISVYQTRIAGFPRNVTVMWCKSLINHSLSLSVERPAGDPPFSCKVDLKPWPFWSKKGFKYFELDGCRVDIFWDLRSAKFSGSPEPCGGYYVAFVCNEEVVLLLGDGKKEAYKRTKSRPSLEDAPLVSKRENVFGKKCFSTRARFDERKKKEHDIVVENSISGPKDPEMWISVDGIVLIHVSNLQWNFRGNQTVVVERMPVQVFWDVHDWLFGAPGSGHALFIFKPGSPAAAESECDDPRSSSSHHHGLNEGAGAESSSAIRSCGSSAPEFSFFLYAWKME